MMFFYFTFISFHCRFPVVLFLCVILPSFFSPDVNNKKEIVLYTSFFFTPIIKSCYVKCKIRATSRTYYIYIFFGGNIQEVLFCPFLFLLLLYICFFFSFNMKYYVFTPSWLSNNFISTWHVIIVS